MDEFLCKLGQHRVKIEEKCGAFSDCNTCRAEMRRRIEAGLCTVCGKEKASDPPAHVTCSRCHETGKWRRNGWPGYGNVPYD